MPIDISRKDLYERVWAEPIQKLSKEYGLSDVGLAKICRRYNIPIPPRGYWAKKQAGKRVSKPALPPEGRKGYGDRVRFTGASSAKPVEQVPPPTTPHPVIAAEADPANAISVPEDLRVRHPLLRSTREYWRMVGRPNFSWSVPLPAHFNINVGRATQARALRLLQALFAALECRGHQVSAGDRGQIRVTVLDENCDVFVRERQRQVRRNSSGTTSKSSDSRPYDLEHSGELEIRIEKRFGRHTVRDGKPPDGSSMQAAHRSSA